MAKAKSRFSILADALVGKYKYKTEGTNTVTADGWTPHNVKSITFMGQGALVSYYADRLTSPDGKSLTYPTKITYDKEGMTPTFIGSPMDDMGNKRTGNDARDDLGAIICSLKGLNANMANVRSLVFFVGGTFGLQLPQEAMVSVEAQEKYLGIDAVRTAVESNQKFGSVNFIILDGNQVNYTALVNQVSEHINKHYSDCLDKLVKAGITKVRIAKKVEKSNRDEKIDDAKKDPIGYSRPNAFDSVGLIQDVDLRSKTFLDNLCASEDLFSWFTKIKNPAIHCTTLVSPTGSSNWVFNTGNYPVDTTLRKHIMNTFEKTRVTFDIACADYKLRQKEIERNTLDADDLKSLVDSYATLGTLVMTIRDRSNLLSNYALNDTIGKALYTVGGGSDPALRANTLDILYSATAKRFAAAATGAQEDFIKPTKTEVKAVCEWVNIYVSKIDANGIPVTDGRPIGKPIPIFEPYSKANDAVVEKFTASQRVNIYCNFVLMLMGVVSIQTALAPLRGVKYKCADVVLKNCAGTINKRIGVKPAINTLDTYLLMGVFRTLLNNVFGANKFDIAEANALFSLDIFNIYETPDLTIDMRVFSQNKNFAIALCNANKGR